MQFKKFTEFEVCDNKRSELHLILISIFNNNDNNKIIRLG